MDSEAALRFLRNHQPMPPDAELTEELIRAYEEVRRHFLHAPDDRCVELLVNSFGEGSGFGVYQLVEDVMARHDPTVVREALKAALRRPSGPGVKYWALQLAAEAPDRGLVDLMKELWSELSADERFWGATLLKQLYQGSADSPFVRQALTSETDGQVQAILSDLARPGS